MENQSNSIEAKEPQTPETDLMGYEGQVQSPAETTLPETSNAQDVQTIINKAVKEVTVDEKTGKYIYPEGMDPVLKAAVAATKSYRDNQSGFTKSQQTLKEIEAERDALREQLATFTSKSLELSPDEQTELDKLYTEDKEAWRHRMNMLEQQSKDEIQDKLDSATEEARKKASGEFELERRYNYLDEFNSTRETPITEEVLDTEVPPRITNKLAKNEITFEEYLDEVAEYLDKGKVVTKASVEQTTDLNKVAGSNSASKQAQEKQGVIDYSLQTF